MSRSSCLALLARLSDVSTGSDLVEVMAASAALLLATLDAAKETTDIEEPPAFDHLRISLQRFLKLVGPNIQVDVMTGRIQ